MHRKVALVVGAFVLTSALSSMADEVLLSELYGSGVHAFNRGDNRAAHADLTAAIQGGSNDPRAYYFRGLVYLRLGREQEAIGDFEKGAGYETSESAGVYSVGRSLERIQGPARQLLERYRSTARITTHKRQEADRQSQYQQRVAAENEVLRQVPPAELPSTPSGAAPPAPAAGADANDPFGAPMPTPSERDRPTPPAESESPFAPTETPMAPAESNPFGAPAPAAPPTAPKPAPMPAENADPFGGDTPTPAPPAEDKPMPQDNPFGAPPTPAPNVPPAETPAATPPATGAGASVKPTRNGVSGLFKSIVGAAPGRGLVGGGPEGSPSGGIFSGLPNLNIPLPGGIGGPPGNGDLGDIPPSAPPSGDDPLGSPPPASPTPAPMPMPPGNAEDPFGPPSDTVPATPAPMPKPAEEDPFGPPSGATPPSPAPMPTPSAGEDPFGPSPPASNDQPAPSPTPSDDPFAN